MLSVNNWKYLKWYMHMLLRHFSDEISVFARKKPLWHPIGTLPPFTHLPFASASWGKDPRILSPIRDSHWRCRGLRCSSQSSISFQFGSGDNGSSIDTALLLYNSYTTEFFCLLIPVACRIYQYAAGSNTVRYHGGMFQDIKNCVLCPTSMKWWSSEQIDAPRYLLPSMCFAPCRQISFPFPITLQKMPKIAQALWH